MTSRVKELLIKESASVKAALKRIQDTSKRVLFVVDNKGSLMGSINDGDIRRWILKKGDLNSSVKMAFNKNPISVKEDYAVDNVKKIMLKHWTECIPVIGNNGQIVDILTWDNIFGKMRQKRINRIKAPVVIMAGGKGKRLDPFTRILPKALLPIGEKPVIEIIIDHFINQGCREFHIILNYKSGMIKSYFDSTRMDAKINYIFEEKLGGTAGGLSILSKNIGKNIFVTNCDILIKEAYKDIYNFHIKNSNDITIVGSMRHFKIPYGVLELKDSGQLKGLIEKPEYDYLINTGMYLIKSDVLKLVPKNTVFHFTSLAKKVMSNGGNVGVYPISEKSWLDVGQWNEYRKNLKHFIF